MVSLAPLIYWKISLQKLVVKTREPQGRIFDKITKMSNLAFRYNRQVKVNYLVDWYLVKRHIDNDEFKSPPYFSETTNQQKELHIIMLFSYLIVS